MPGERDDEVEHLRRALYRAGSGGADVRSYLEARRPDGVALAPDVPEPQRVRAVRLARPVWIGAAVALALLLVPAPAGSAPLYRLADPDAGAFSAAFAVPAGTTAASGSLWSTVHASSMFVAARGAEVASAEGTDFGYAPVRAAAVASEGSGPLTVFVDCGVGEATVGLVAISQDFDGAHQTRLDSATVRCGHGIQGLRYRDPQGIVPAAVSVTGAGPVRLSMVAGL